MKVGCEMETSPPRRYGYNVQGLLILDSESALGSASIGKARVDIYLLGSS